MPLRKSTGNMYSWVTHTHSHLGGECPHKCAYCYVQAIGRRFGGGRYTGELCFVEHELSVSYGVGRTIFVEHCNDLFATRVPEAWISAVMKHCKMWPKNEYVFQTKNPRRAASWVPYMPDDRLLGCTLETVSRFEAEKVSAAPSPLARYNAMLALHQRGERLFISVEPILRGNMAVLAKWVADIQPEFVVVGADSKGAALNEPSPEDVRYLLAELDRHGIEIKRKKNLGRLLDLEQ